MILPRHFVSSFPHSSHENEANDDTQPTYHLMYLCTSYHFVYLCTTFLCTYEIPTFLCTSVLPNYLWTTNHLMYLCNIYLPMYYLWTTYHLMYLWTTHNRNGMYSESPTGTSHQSEMTLDYFGISLPHRCRDFWTIDDSCSKTRGQSYKHYTIGSYESRVIMTLES